jgi:hypothetical protein
MPSRAQAENLAAICSQEMSAAADAERSSRAAKIAAMNIVAEVMIDTGPTTDLRAYLFAMHGLKRTEDEAAKSGTQRRYEDFERLFHHRRIGEAFAQDSREIDNGFSPIKRYFSFPRTLFDEFMRNAGEAGSRREFSAVHYRVERQRGGDGDVYVGRLIVPAFSLEASDIRKAVPTVAKAKYEVLREARAEQEDMPRDVHGTPVETLFGRDIANWAQRGSIECQIQALEDIRRAERLLGDAMDAAA